MKVKTAQPAALQSCLAVRQGCLKEKGTKDVPNSAPTIYHDVGVFHAYAPVDGFQMFELEVAYHKDQTVSHLDPLTIYVAGGIEKLNQLLEKWNRGENFKYEVKP